MKINLKALIKNKKALILASLVVSAIIIILLFLTKNNQFQTEAFKYQANKIPELTKLLKENPDNHRVQFDLATAYYVTNKKHQAINSYQKAIELNPQADYYNGLANCWRDLKKYDQAIEQYQLAIKQDKNYKNAYINLANLYSKQHQYQQAAKTYQQSSKVFLDDLTLLYYQAVMLKQANQIDQAKEVIKTILAKDSNNQAALSLQEQLN